MLTADECRSALFVDFEGLKDSRPSFVGVAWDAMNEVVLQQTNLDERLRGAADTKNLRTQDLATFVTSLAARAQRERRVVVAWSEHELDIFNCVDGEPAARLRRMYRNAIAVVDEWRRWCAEDQARCRHPLPADNALASFLKYFDYSVPNGQGPGLVAAAIRDVAEGLDRRHGDYAKLTPVMKGKWTRALGHNAHDCLGLRTVARRMRGLV